MVGKPSLALKMAMKHLLLIAFHYPPAATSSGVQRAIAFSRHLPEHGWRVTVYTVQERAHPPGPKPEPIPEGVRVVRGFALDTARHLTIAGRYPRLLALPDRWASWGLFGLSAAMNIVREDRPDLIMSTYPIASAHWLAERLARKTGIPLVADFRDPMVDPHYPVVGSQRKIRRGIEDAIAQRCALGLCTTPGTLSAYRDRYTPADKWRLLPNGFREDSFAGIAPAARPAGSPRLLLHSGVVYPSERDPRQLFAALATLKQSGRISAATLRLRFRACGHEQLFQPQVDALGIADLVEFAPPIPYREALAEMLGADALLLMQASNCNAQVPAKLYEYFRARRPILALTDAAGDTARSLQEVACARLAPLDDEAAISAALPGFLDALPDLQGRVMDEATVQTYSREGQCQQLAQWLDELVT